MKIAINAGAAFKEPRTGVEEYAYQLIKHLAMLKESGEHRFLLYCQKKSCHFALDAESIKDNFQIRQLSWPLPMWTQVRLAFELGLNKPDVLFIPVHVLPITHPRNSVVAIHGLEYEYYPEMYPKKHLAYLKQSAKYALKRARKIIAVSQNTKNDLVDLYGADPRKIIVIHHGLHVGDRVSNIMAEPFKKGFSGFSDFSGVLSVSNASRQPYFLYIGRLENKKNVVGLIRAFNLMKTKHKIDHRLILVGPRGHGYKESIAHLIKNDVVEKGYVSQVEKEELLAKADCFVLPSFYEGFGMPLLEAQGFGCPVITSDISSMPEVVGKSGLLVNPRDIEQISEMMYKVITDNELKKDLVKRGYENIKRFSWQKCARETLKVLTET